LAWHTERAKIAARRPGDAASDGLDLTQTGLTWCDSVRLSATGLTKGRWLRRNCVKTAQKVGGLLGFEQKVAKVTKGHCSDAESGRTNMASFQSLAFVAWSGLNWFD
jgi:hypothetical protein